MNENDTGQGITFVPNRIINSQGNINILGALHIVQAQTGKRLCSKPASIYGHAY
jgi:hypothetical protein